MTTSPSPDDSWIVVAKILRPHGLRGTFRLKALTRDPEMFIEAGTEQYQVRHEGTIIETLTIESSKISKGIVYAKFKGVTDRSSAEKYTNMELVIPEADRWELPVGEYYVDQLKGLDVYDGEKTAEPIGQITAAQEGTVHDFLEFTHKDHPEQKAMLPLIPEFILEVNLAEGFVRVEIPDGLFD